MKRKREAWQSIVTLIFIVGIVEIVLFALIVRVPDYKILFIVLMALTAIVAIFRAKKITADAKIAKKVASLRQKTAQSGGTSTANIPFYNKTTTQTATAAPASHMAFFSTLKKVAKEYAYKAQRQKYASYESLQGVCDKLNAYALSRGIKLGEKTAEGLLMAMASSKCVFVKKSGENTEDILSLVGEFFSGENSDCLQLETTPAHASGLLHYYQDSVLTCTEFFKKVYSTAFISDTVCTCTLKDFSQVPFANVFSEFINLFKNPYGDCICRMTQIAATDIPKIQDRKFIFPKNTWFFFLLNGDEQLPQDASLWSETIEVKGVGSKTSAPAAVLPMAYSQFNELIEGAFDENFLPLDTWKKLDKVEDYLFGAIGFKIDNILARQIERLTTMQVACGGSHAHAMDVAIAHKILPLLADYQKEQIDQEGTSLKELLDGLFGAENLPECHKALSVLQLD